LTTEPVFNAWLRAQRKRHDSVVGDLARDVSRDHSFPAPTTPSMSIFVQYLDHRVITAPWAYVGLALAWAEFLSGGGNPTLKEVKAHLRQGGKVGRAIVYLDEPGTGAM